MKFFTQTQMKISIHPNQWIINYVGTRYRIEDSKKRSQPSTWKTVYTVDGRYEGWREKREWGGGSTRCVIMAYLTDLIGVGA